MQGCAHLPTITALQDMQNMVLKVRSYCSILSRLMKHEKEHSLEEKVAVLRTVTSEDVIQYGRKFFQNVFVVGFHCLAVVVNPLPAERSCKSEWNLTY